ncbi:MAG: fumarylacetoacetate hydrolase family protein [Bryobacteraceae bacterium]|nr:fumarylacetoacetate hydrolase family protein [Bryobacteraceae bacterium]
MKIGQVHWQGRLTAAVFRNGEAHPIPGYTVAELIESAPRKNMTFAQMAADYAARGGEYLEPAIPVLPREAWACGCTYEMSAAFRDAEHGTREGFYRHVYEAPRPEIFFKGTARVCTGPGGPIGIRRDSKFTAPEPELAVLLGHGGEVLGYTLANDVSAWDIERENPLYLPQSKVYQHCCSLGPWFVTPDELPDPYSLQMTCVIRRGGAVLFEGSVSPSKLNRRIETLIEYLLRSNPVPPASVLLTGTGIIVPQEAALQPGDVVEIRVPEIGALANEAVLV